MYQYIFIIVGVTRDVSVYIFNSRRYQRCIIIFIIVGATRDVSVYV